MTAVLITGATTPVGVGLVRQLLADPAVTRILAVAREARWDALRDDERFVYQAVDLRRQRRLRELLFGPCRALEIDTVVHGAVHRSAAAVGARVHELNVEATRLLLRLSERHPTIRSFIFQSFGQVYRLDNDQPNLIGEDHPLDLSPEAPQWVRDRVEADLTVCTRMGMTPLRVVVLRFAEILAPNTGSQLLDYLQSRVCLRPLGFDPMINLMTPEDAVEALVATVKSNAGGIFNIPGRDTLPLSAIVDKSACVGVAVPGPLLAPLYELRSRTLGTEFRYDLNSRRFHFNGILDGTRAREVLGYEPRTPIAWRIHQQELRSRSD